MPRYVETSVRLSKDQLREIKRAIDMGDELVLTCKLHKAKVPIEANEVGIKIPLTPIQKGRVGAGRPVKLSSAQSRYMKGRGFLTDLAKVGSAVVQSVADEFVEDSEAANKVSDLLLDTADKVERAFTGKKQFDYTQASRNANTAIENAKKFLKMSGEQQRRKHQMVSNIPFVPKVSFDEYLAMQEDLASRSLTTPTSVKKQRMTRWREDPAAVEAANKIVSKGKAMISKELEKAGIDPAISDSVLSAAKDITGSGLNYFGGRMGKGDINDQMANYLRLYIDEE